MDAIAKNILGAISERPCDVEAYRDLMSLMHQHEGDGCLEHTSLVGARRVLSTAIKGGWATANELEELASMLRDALVLDARFDLDAFMQAMEFDRAPESRLWLPRRGRLMKLCRELQWFEASEEAEFLSVSLPPRTGKALAFDTPVLTERGFVEHGDLTIRDRVLGPDGRWKRVLAIHEPCQMEYEVEFTNGEKVVCHGAHEWVLYDRRRCSVGTYETKYLFEHKIESGTHGRRGHRYLFQLENRRPLSGDEVELPVSPYALGAWLGDGRTDHPDMCCHKDDVSVIHAIEECGYPITWHTTHKTTGVLYFGFRSLRDDLQKLGMCYSRKTVEKRIPDSYLVAPIEQRLELLAGLLDTDGCLSASEHRYHFTTSGEMLRDGFVSLVSTFGWRVSVVRCEPGKGGMRVMAKKPYWVISFCPNMYIPCRLERKQLREFSKQRRVSLKSIRRVENAPMGNCITVEGGVYCVGRTMVATHNSSICGMFMAWHAGLHPEHSNLMTAHSDKLTKHFYVQELQYVSDPEYNFSEIFPGSPLVWKSSEDEAFSLRKHTAYPTVTCRSVEGTLTGAVEVGEGGVLYSDDLVKDLEEAMSPRRLEAKWEAYVNQCYDRRKKGAKQLMVGTRWDVADPMGRMTGLHEGERGFHVLTIPALDPHTGESNFDYLYGVGFDRRYYLDMRKTTDEATYAAKYDGAPRVRQGQLYSPETLERYLSLPPGLPSKVVAVVDTKGTGEDYCAMPVAAKWDSSPKWFVIDAVCDNSSPKTVNQLLVNCIERNNVNQVSFESNSGGGKVAEDVEAILKSDGHLCSVHKKFSGSNKETRILASSPWVIGTCVFKDSSLYEAGSDYERFMNQMFSFVLDGKNAHDDAPDSMSMLADFLSTSAVNRATAVRRPF